MPTPNNPQVTVNLRKTKLKANPQGYHARGVVVGYTQLGTRNQIFTLRSDGDLAQFGNGEGVEQAAELGDQAGYPLYLVPVDGTGQTPATPAKAPATLGIPKTLYGTLLAYGSALFLGADHNGDILYRALVSGATIRHVVAGTSTPRSIGVVGSAVTVNVATDGAGAVANTETATSILASVLADSAANLLVTGSIAGGGTGASLVAAVAASTLNNGAIDYQALAPNVTVTHVLPTTAGQSLSVPPVVNGNIIVNLATNADKEPTSTAAQVVAAILAQVTAAALVTPTAGGSGAGLAGALANAQLDDGAVIFTAITDAATTVAHVVSGSNTALSVPPVSGGHVIVNVGTDSAGFPVSTAAAIAAAVMAVPTAAALVTATAGGAGTGKAGAKTQTALQYGSTGALTVAGTSHDQHTIGVRITRPGTVGAAGLAFVWTADNWVTESSDVLIPSTGAVALKDSKLDTGLTITFTGVLDKNDAWLFVADKPLVAFADIQAAIDVIKAATSYKLGFITSPTVLSRTQTQQIDQALQAEGVRNVMWLRFYGNVRDYNTGETIPQWEAAIGNDFLGFFSANGLVRMCAGFFSHLSTYSGRNYRRPAVFQEVARRCSLAVHQDAMEKALGGLLNIRYAVAADGTVIDPGIYYDCFPSGALQSQRFICLRSWPGEPGQFYINTSPTMSDPSDQGYSRVEYSDVVFEASRICQGPLDDTVGKTYRDIPEPESDLIPAGALDPADAQIIDDDVNEAVEAFLYGIKTDGNTSASPMPVGQRPYATRRDYAYANENPRTVRGALSIRLRGVNEQVVVDVTPSLGA